MVKTPNSHRWRKISKLGQQKVDERKVPRADSSLYDHGLAFLGEPSMQTQNPIPCKNTKLASKTVCKQHVNAKTEAEERHTKMGKASNSPLTFVDEGKDARTTLSRGNFVSYDARLQGVDARVSSTRIGSSQQQNSSNLMTQDQDIQKAQHERRQVNKKTTKEKRERSKRYFDLIIDDGQRDVTLSAISMDEEWFERLHEESQASVTTTNAERMKQISLGSTGHDNEKSAPSLSERRSFSAARLSTSRLSEAAVSVPRAVEHSTGPGAASLSAQTTETPGARYISDSSRRLLTIASREAIELDTAFLTSLLVQPTKPSITWNASRSSGTMRRRHSSASCRKSSPPTIETANKSGRNNFNFKKPSPSTVNAIQSSPEWKQHQQTLSDWKRYVNDKRKALQLSMSQSKLK